MDHFGGHLGRPCGTAIVLALLAFISAPARAATVDVEISSRQVYVGAPFLIRIEIADLSGPEDYEAPEFPPIPGLRKLSGPSASTSSFTQIINNRRTHRETVTLTYQFVAEQPGELVIPAFTVVADGEPFTSRPMTITATKSETGDLMSVHIVAERDAYYLGESISAALEIWLRPFRPSAATADFNAAKMWRQVLPRRSSWGAFAESLENVRYRQATGPDADGADQVYYVYILRTEIMPTQVGKLAFDDIGVVVDYPVSAQLVRDFFRRDWVVTDSRPIVGTPENGGIEIRDTPAEGRPPYYTGAVGRFSMDVTARPTEVAVGDPITLTMTIFDVTPGGAPLDLLQPPPLDRLGELTADFRVPADPLAGVVEDRTKTFTQTIRAKDDTVEAIPPIPFAYFDPQTERYVTVTSKPIPITVVAAAALTMEDVVGGESARQSQATELTEVAGGILANHLGPEVLASQQPFALRWPHLALVAAPPLLFAFIAVGQRRSRRLRDDRGYARRRSAKRNALKRLAAAARCSDGLHAEAVALAVSDYVADRCNLPAGALTGAEVVERLRSSGIADGLVADIESVLQECETLRYGGGAATADDSIAERAARCIRRLQRERIG